MWTLLETLDWKFLPFPGGLLEQEEWLMDDLAVIAWRRGIIDELTKADVSGRGKVYAGKPKE